MSKLKFTLDKKAKDYPARAGKMETLHGEVLTPVFMPVGTQATVKSQNIDSLKLTGAQVLLANTYHLSLRPGIEVFKKMGGIHKWTKWSGSYLTDSGGFQIFSLKNDREVTDDGARFKSYLDGSAYMLSPESSIEMQKAIGADIMMVLDQCVPSTSEKALVLEALKRTHLWAKRSLVARGDSPQALFGIAQGALDLDLRRQSVEEICSLPFDGFAIGGLAVGEGRSEREDTAEWTASLLPWEKPRYLMGVGTPIDLLEGVRRGVDLFDCILPTSMAQHGVAYTLNGVRKLNKTLYKFDSHPIEDQCSCKTCRTYSRSYLHHLIRAKEPLGWHLIGVHNLFTYHQLMSEMRKAILEDRFESFYQKFRNRLAQKLDHESLPLVRGDYEVLQQSNPDGQVFFSLKQRSSGEVMHSINPPQIESLELYIEQSQLKTRLSENLKEPLIVWDVGLGAATNAMGAIRVAEESALNRSLHLVSFENDLNSIHLAIQSLDRFFWLNHEAPARLLKHHEWIGLEGKIRWQLHLGDVLEKMESAPKPDVIFWDPFSYKTNPELWSLECFLRLKNRCFDGKDGRLTTLYTYSSSTAIRSGLLAAGFFVSKGVKVLPKNETTIAFSANPRLNFDGKAQKLLDRQWLEHWRRSSSRKPLSKYALVDHWDEQISNHPQFS